MFQVRSNSVNRLISVCLVVIFAFSVISPAEASTETAGLTAQEFQKGMCFATWQKNRFNSKYSDKALAMLKDMGVTYVQITVTQYQQKFNSTKIAPSDLTPSDSSIKHAIKTAHKLGLKVMLKPHIDLISEEGGSYWRADIGFYDEDGWEKWFKSYNKFIRHYAKIAKKYKTDMFCVGTELSFTTQKVDRWKEVIANVKKIYKGKLIYAANWDNYKNIEFWDELDFVGIDAYFPLTYAKKPTVEDIKSGWQKWQNEIEAWYQKEQRPIVFTEIGYASSSHASSEPWRSGYGEADVELQAKCYVAFFETIWTRPWLAGVYWWRWAPSIYGGGKYNRHFTPLKKPAAKILTERYNTESERLNAIVEEKHEEQIVETVEVQNKVFGPKVDMQLLPSESIIKDPYMGIDKNINAVNVGTINPALKTKYDFMFKGAWKNKQDKLMEGASIL